MIGKNALMMHGPSLVYVHTKLGKARRATYM